MNSFFKVLLLLFLSAVSSLLLGQEVDSVANSEYFSIRAEAPVALSDKNDFTIIPIAFYTPETTFGFGIGGQGTFYTKGSSVLTRPSSLFFSGVYTARKQLLLIADPKIYFNNERFLLEGQLQFKIFPDYFWGIGNKSEDNSRENYNMRSVILKAAFLRRLKPYVNFGFEYEFNAYSMLTYEDKGLVESSPYFKEKTILSGFAMVLNYDSRDNYQSPSLGSYFSLKTGVASRTMGSTSAFNYATFDTRKYFSLTKSNRFILALQFFLNTTNGRVPFQKLSRYGGSINTRGYYLGRYTANNMLVLQTELRLKLKGKWSTAAFGTVGDVYNEVSDLRGDLLKTSVGGGLRWKIREGDPSLLRLDIAYGFNVDEIGVYFGVNEAF